METNKNQLWQAALGELELKISKAKFSTWFKNTGILSFSEGEFVIGVPNAFAKEWLEKKHNKEIFQSLQNVSKRNIKKIRYEVAKLQDFASTMIKTAPKTEVNVNDIPYSDENGHVDTITNLNPKYTFKSFIVGASNELAHAACLAVANKPGTEYNPLFIYGGVGLGKTHLLHAIGNQLNEKHRNKGILYTTSERFTSALVNAIRNQEADKFKEKYMRFDVLIIDDVQFLAGKDKTKEELFHIFNSLYGANKQIVFSSDRPPKAIPTLEDRLRSRFEGGMIADIGLPEFETRKAILNKKCKEKNYEIPDNVLDFIATNVQHNIRELEGALNRVIAHSQLNDSTPSLDSTKNILSNIISNPKKNAVSLKQIIEVVSGFYDLEDKEIRGTSRKKEIVNPRQIAMYLMREESNASYPSIGQELGGRDHTTAMHACEKITRSVEINEALRQEIDLIKQKLYMA